MLIKKRWTWLLSVMLLGFLASANGPEGDGSLSVVQPPVMKSDVLSGSTIEVIEEHPKCKGEEEGHSLTCEDKLALLGMHTETMTKKDDPLESRSFPYAIDSPPSVVNISAMLSYCVYHESLTLKQCEKFWEDTCERDALHHYQLDNLNAVTVCENEDRVYVAFAGTQSLSDAIVDATVFSRMMNYTRKKLFAHGGFVERSKQYSRWVIGTLLTIPGIAHKEIILTGHSLGAAQATLLAHDVYEGLGLDVHGGGVSNALNQVKVIGYASPSVVLDPASYFLGHLNHLRVYNPNDPVAMIFSTISGYSHVGVQLAVPDEPSRHIARAVPRLDKQSSLKLVHDLPYSYWKSLPALSRSRFDLGLDAHTMDSYTLAAAPLLKEHQEARDGMHRSLTAIVNVEKVLNKRVGAPVTCKLQRGKVVCTSNKKIVAKFRYALDAPPTGQEVDACMSSIMSANFIPGLTVNAGLSLGRDMSPATVASEALILDTSAGDKWYGWMTSKMLADLYLDGSTIFPDACERKATLLEPARTLPTERALIRKYLNSAPRLFTVTKSHITPANETVELIADDGDFFSDKQQDDWMDCRLPENNVFCPTRCVNDNPACAVMKKWGTDDNGTNYWVSLSKDSGMKWVDDSNAWKYTITERSNSWFPIWRSQSQATFVVVRDDPEDYLQFSN